MADKAWKQFERTCAEWFSRWLSGKLESDLVEDTRVIARQALLGRMVERIWGDMAIHPKIAPRMQPLARWFMDTFMVDAKLRKKFKLPSLLTYPDHEFWTWWEKLTDDAVKSNAKQRLMVLMENHSKTHILAFGEKERDWFEEHGAHIDGSNFPKLKLEFFQTRGTIRDAKDRVTFCEFEAFLKWVDPTRLGCPEVQHDEVPPATEGVGQQEAGV